MAHLLKSLFGKSSVSEEPKVKETKVVEETKSTQQLNEAVKVGCKGKTFVVIVLDGSGSMSGLSDTALNDFNATLKTLKETSLQNGQETILTVIAFGDEIVTETDQKNVYLVDPKKSYRTNGGTPLFDATGTAIENLKKIPVNEGDNVAYLVMVITDGDENQSKKWNATTLGQEIRACQATGKWSFVFRVPHGASHYFEKLEIPKDNILEWEQTEQSFTAATQRNTAGLECYMNSRSKGTTAAKSFYSSQPDSTSSSSSFF